MLYCRRFPWVRDVSVYKHIYSRLLWEDDNLYLLLSDILMTSRVHVNLYISPEHLKYRNARKYLIHQYDAGTWKLMAIVPILETLVIPICVDWFSCTPDAIEIDMFFKFSQDCFYYKNQLEVEQLATWIMILHKLRGWMSVKWFIF